MAMVAIHDAMFTEDVITDPYTYYGRLREEDPVHWNDKYALWVITRHDDVVWMTRHHELFSNAFFRNDPRPAYPAIPASDEPLYDYVRQYQADQFIQFDRPAHLEMCKVVHSYFTPRAMEAWRGFVKNAITELLDAAEDQGRMDGHEGCCHTAAGARDCADDGRPEGEAALRVAPRRKVVVISGGGTLMACSRSWKACRG